MGCFMADIFGVFLVLFGLLQYLCHHCNVFLSLFCLLFLGHTNQFCDSDIPSVKDTITKKYKNIVLKIVDGPKDRK